MKYILKKYDVIKDIIIFGSFVKGRPNPKDIDVAFIVKEKDPKLVSLIKDKLITDKIDLEFIEIGDLYYSNKFFINLILEGYSIKKDDFLKNILNIKPKKLYSYNLKHLNKSKKTLFGMALKRTLKKIKGEKISIGSVLIPLEETSYFEDFLDVWGMKYKTKEWIVI
ncbi:MAG: nucleotidyltransferase domain-containing protein [Candidatus Nanoarchaeia archaeon]|nr:nucleotidyltransferase domain-containing protein [Candidatus Nanoarchaeia archaeon]